jgi:hypothetical protein
MSERGILRVKYGLAIGQLALARLLLGRYNDFRIVAKSDALSFSSGEIDVQ